MCNVGCSLRLSHQAKKDRWWWRQPSDILQVIGRAPCKQKQTSPVVIVTAQTKQQPENWQVGGFAKLII